MGRDDLGVPTASMAQACKLLVISSPIWVEVMSSERSNHSFSAIWCGIWLLALQPPFWICLMVLLKALLLPKHNLSFTSQFLTLLLHSSPFHHLFSTISPLWLQSLGCAGMAWWINPHSILQPVLRVKNVSLVAYSLWASWCSIMASISSEFASKSVAFISYTSGLILASVCLWHVFPREAFTCITSQKAVVLLFITMRTSNILMILGEEYKLITVFIRALSCNDVNCKWVLLTSFKSPATGCSFTSLLSTSAKENNNYGSDHKKLFPLKFHAAGRIYS
jgi:hypothetical protein